MKDINIGRLVIRDTERHAFRWIPRFTRFRNLNFYRWQCVWLIFNFMWRSQ